MKAQAKLNGTYDYSSTQFNLPPQIANKIINWGKENIPDENLYHDEDGGKGREDEIHCTLLYGIHAEESPEILELVKEPIKVKLGKVEKFDNDDYDVIKVTVLDKSGKLEELWNRIKDAEEYTSDYDKKFEPHVTIAYVKKGSCDDIIDSDPFAGDIVVLDNFKFSSTDKSKTKFKKLSSKNKPQPIEVREYLYHKSSPYNRDEIKTHGLEPRLGSNSDGYYEGEPAIFATNSNNVADLFDTSYDDDIWQIDARSGVKWFLDPYFKQFDAQYFHVITFEHVLPEYLKLVYEGSGEDDNLTEEQSEEFYAGGDYPINDKLKDLKLAMRKHSSYSDEDESQILEEVEDLIKKEFTDREIVRYLKEAFNLDSEDAYWFINAVQRSLNEPNELQQMVKDKEYNKTYLQTKAVSYGSTSYGSRTESLKEYPVYLHYLGEPDELENHYLIGNWLLVIEGTPARYYLGQLLDYARGEKDKLVIDGGTNWTIHNMDKVVEEAYGLAKYLNPEMKKQSVKQMFTLQIGNATDMMRAIQALDELQNVRLNYTVSGDALLFGKQEDLNDARTLLKNNGILALEKRSAKADTPEYLASLIETMQKNYDLAVSGKGKVYISLEKMKQDLDNAKGEYQNLIEQRKSKDKPKYYPSAERNDWSDDDFEMEDPDTSIFGKTAITKDHITEDLGRFDTIKEDAQNIEKNVDELKKDDNNLLKTMNINKYNFFTGEDEPVEVESEVIAVVDGMGEDMEEEVEATEECACEQIDPNQSKREIASQLMDTFISRYPRAKTTENIFNCAKECGLVDAMDRYDVVNIMNAVATDVGLARQGFDEFFPEEEITESADIRGTSGAPEFNEGDMEGALQEFKESFDNVAESLYEVDRVLEERYRMLYDGDKLVDESKDIVREALHKVKKEAIVKKYFMSDFKVKTLDRSGRCVEGKLIWKVQMTQAGKINRTIEVSLPIKANQVIAPMEFSYNGEAYPLKTYFINDIFDR